MLNLNTDTLLEILSGVANFQNKPRFLVAFSGGADTTVLLHLMHDAKDQCEFTLAALHVDHGIHPQSREWENHCAQFCQARGITFRSTRLDQLSTDGKFTENSARNARYTWFKDEMVEGDILLTAHHMNDQAETFLLNLMRGAGARGLSGIQLSRNFGAGLLVRPLLKISKAQILEYVDQNNLNFIDDPANADLEKNRNYLRHISLPSLQQRWPSAVENISRSAEYLSDSRLMLESLAAIDADDCRSEGTGYLSVGYQLDLNEIRKLDRARQINLIRYWVRSHTLPEPGREILKNFLKTTVNGDAEFAEMSWTGYKIYLYQNNIYLTYDIVPPSSDQRVWWNLQQPLLLESVGIKLVPHQSVGSGLSIEKVPDEVSVGFRVGGERLKLARSQHTSELKKLFQSHSIPPWERNILPLIYSGDKLAAAVPWGVADEFHAENGQHGVEITLERISKPA